VCVLVPDATRSCPLPALLDTLHACLHRRAAQLTFMVALGTHPALSEEQLAALFGYPPGHSEQRYPGVTIRNHEWWQPEMLVSTGVIPGGELAELSGGRLADPVEVRVNRAVVDSDVTLVVGPVFPHEVVGFSGGNKYLFPGVSGPELIDVSHWLGALITSAEIIGSRGVTPVRALINRAAATVPSRLRCFGTGTRQGVRTLPVIPYRWRHTRCRALVRGPGRSRLRTLRRGAVQRSCNRSHEVGRQALWGSATPCNTARGQTPGLLPGRSGWPRTAVSGALRRSALSGAPAPDGHGLGERRTRLFRPQRRPVNGTPRLAGPAHRSRVLSRTPAQVSRRDGHIR
jgi:Lactate racemase N-terminal domain